MKLFPGINDGETIFKWGAYYVPAIQEGQYYRFITPIFMQIAIPHLLFNLFAIFLFASVLEDLIGRFKFILLYMIAGIAGYIATYLFSSSDLSLGASGAIFGVLGAFLYLSTRSSLLDPASKRTIVPMLVMNLIITFVEPNISITGHLGGLVGGYALALLFRIDRLRQR
ncbi:MAG: peptidase family protein [Bacilli bacterium]|nr:peptidase family protein [Bacilli bacterium]